MLLKKLTYPLLVCAGVLCSQAAQAQNSITVSATSISLNYTLQSEKVPSQTITVGTIGAATTVAVSVLNAGTPSPFLAVTPTGCPATPCTLTVAAASSTAIKLLDALKPGVNYSGSFQLIGGAGVASSPVVNVSLTILAAQSPTIAATPASSHLVAPPCTTLTPAALLQSRTVEAHALNTPDATASQCIIVTTQLQISSLNNTAGVVTIASSNPSVKLSESSGTVPATGDLVVTISWDTTGATQGNSTAVITVTPGSGLAIAITITLTISSNESVTATPSSFAFNITPGSASPLPQTLALDGPPATFKATITASPTNPCPDNALLVSPSSGVLGSGPASMRLGLNPAVSFTASCTEVIGLNFAGAANSGMTIPVSINVQTQTSLSVLTVDENPATVSVPAQGIIVASGTKGQVSVAAQNSDLVTVKLSSGTTPTIYTVSPSQAASALGSGIFAGHFEITSPSLSTPLSVPYSLAINGSPLLTSTPGSIHFAVQQGDINEQSRLVTLSGTPGSYVLTPFPANIVRVDTSVLTVPASGAVQFILTLTPGGLTNTVSGGVSFTPSGSAISSFTMPYTATVTSTPVNNLAIDEDSAQPLEPDICTCETCACPVESSLMFFANSFTPNDPDYTVSVTTLGGRGNVATVSPSNLNVLGGSTPSAVLLQINPGTPAGNYIGTVNLTEAGSSNPIQFPWTAIVPAAGSTNLLLDTRAVPFYKQAAGSSSASQSAVALAHPNASAPPSQTIHLTSLNGASQMFVAIGPSWLTITPASGSTPQTLTVSANASALDTLPAGTYVGTLVIAGSTAPYPLRVPVHLVIGGSQSISMVNAASGRTDPVSPGEIVSIFGSNIGPISPAGLTLTPAGTVSTTLANTQVLFDGVAAALTYAGSGQINAIVPYEVGGHRFAHVVVQSAGATTGETVLEVDDSDPAIFAAAGGTGQGAILNQDGTVNGSSSPAAPGSIIVIYATGEGILNPAVATASVTPSTGTSFPKPVLPVTVTIAGQPAPIAYAGEAPGFASGVFQLDVTIPAGIGSGPQPVVVTVGHSNNAAQNVTVAVQ